jgi:hypothetical protein
MRISAFVLSSMAVIGTASAHAENNDVTTCSVEVAVSRPPIDMNMSVAFNVTSSVGFSKSITMKAGQESGVIDGLPCYEGRNGSYTITATPYSPGTQMKALASGIGQWTLKAGDIYLLYPNNSVSVVFPQDFQDSSSKS